MSLYRSTMGYRLSQGTLHSKTKHGLLKMTQLPTVQVALNMIGFLSKETWIVIAPAVFRYQSYWDFSLLIRLFSCWSQRSFFPRMYSKFENFTIYWYFEACGQGSDKLSIQCEIHSFGVEGVGPRIVLVV